MIMLLPNSATQQYYSAWYSAVVSLKRQVICEEAQ